MTGCFQFVRYEFARSWLVEYRESNKYNLFAEYFNLRKHSDRFFRSDFSKPYASVPCVYRDYWMVGLRVGPCTSCDRLPTNEWAQPRSEFSNLLEKVHNHSLSSCNFETVILKQNSQTKTAWPIRMPIEPCGQSNRVLVSPCVDLFYCRAR